MKITSPAFNHNDTIPVKYSCDGKNISPPLRFEGIPDNAESLVLMIEDPDAPRGLFVHWVVYDIPVTSADIPENKEPPGVSGTNDFGRTGYGGPCPPSGTHRYFFKLYAIDKELGLTAGKKRSEVRNAMEGHVVEQAELIGLYSRQ